MTPIFKLLINSSTISKSLLSVFIATGTYVGPHYSQKVDRQICNDDGTTEMTHLRSGVDVRNHITHTDKAIETKHNNSFVNQGKPEL